MYQRAIQLNPNYAPARLWYSNLLQSTGRSVESVEQIQRAAELDPLSAVIKENLADRLAQQGHFHEAETTYRRAITIEPSRPGSYVSLAMLNAFAFNRFVDGVPLAEKAKELDPDSPGSSVDLALLYHALGDDKMLLETTAQAAGRWPDSPAVQFRMALDKLVRMDVAGAVRHAQRCVDGYQRHEWALAILRNADMQGGRDDVALARYAKAYPEFFKENRPRIDGFNVVAPIDIALLYQKRGDSRRANVLMDGTASTIRTAPRLGSFGYGIADVRIHALRGNKRQALAALRQAEQAGWRLLWRYYRDFDPALDSIRNEPEFKAIFADIERDMARQRAELAARRKDAKMEL
jgi:tetratricopeptide (TPR) repeat protein